LIINYHCFIFIVSIRFPNQKKKKSICPFAPKQHNKTYYQQQKERKNISLFVYLFGLSIHIFSQTNCVVHSDENIIILFIFPSLKYHFSYNYIITIILLIFIHTLSQYSNKIEKKEKDLKIICTSNFIFISFSFFHFISLITTNERTRNAPFCIGVVTVTYVIVIVIVIVSIIIF